MIRITCIVFLILVFTISANTSCASALPIIFDTDMCGDCDDVLALGMIHSLESRGLCRLVAVTVSADHELAAPLVNAINTFYGRGDVPIGVVDAVGVRETSQFLDMVNQREKDGSYRFPHQLLSGRSAPSALRVLRHALALQPDQSVVMVQVGFSTNLARLLESPADSDSLLIGRDLVKRKVKSLSLMAGAFKSINGKSHYLEYNVIKDMVHPEVACANSPLA